MKKKRFTPARFIKYFTVVFLLAVLSIIALNFISRSKKRVKFIPSQGELVKQKVEHKENIIYFEDKEGKLRRKVRVDKYYVGKDGWYHLEGNVEITFLEAVEGEDVFFSGDKIIHNKEATQFRLSGNAIVKFKDIVFKSLLLEYEADIDTLSSDQGITFSAEEISGSARKVEFQVKKEKLKLLKDVKLELSKDNKSEKPLFVSGDKLNYSYKRGDGLIEGDVVFNYGKSHIQANRMNFVLFRDKENINSIFLEGDVFLSLIAEEETEPEDNYSLMSAAVKREVTAKEIVIKNYKENFKIRSMEAKGNCSFLSVTSSGNSSEIRAESMNCSFTANGILTRFKAKQRVNLIEQRVNQDSRRTIQGDYLSITGKKSALKIKGGNGLKAIVQSEDYRVSAGEIDIIFDNNNIIAREGIGVILYPRESQNSTLGFFSKEKPVFITAKEMRYIEEHQRFLFKDNMKVWQGQDVLKAKELTLYKDTGRFEGRESVESVFSFTPKNNEEAEKIRISSDSIEFKPDESVLIYKKDCVLNVKNTELQAQSLSVTMHQDSAELINIVAYTDVKILQNTYEGEGKKASYDLEEETIVLMGNPVLIDRDKGETKGDKLTFSLADGKIFIENRGQKRSKTVIK